MHGVAVHLREVDHRLLIRILRSAAVRTLCPAAELIAGSRVTVLRERRRKVIGMLRIRDCAAHIAAVRLILHRVVIRGVACVNRLILRHRGTEGVRCIATRLPAVKVMAGLVVRTSRLGRRISVRNKLRRNVLIRRRCIRSVVDRDRVAVSCPNRL